MQRLTVGVRVQLFRVFPISCGRFPLAANSTISRTQIAFLLSATSGLEMARAPDSAMRILEPVLATKHLMTLYQNPRNEEHRPLLIVLLGITGGAEPRLLINGRVQENLMRHQTFSMPALLVAHLEMAGLEAGSLIFEKYIADDSRTMEEAKSAVVALSVLGNANTLVSRDAVISLYRDML